jgi:chemotaxis protein methyltransferase CheR
MSDTTRISDAEFAQVRALALRLAGISLPASKKAMVVSRWGRRLAHHGLKSYREYLDLIADGRESAELQISLDLLTTNETNFFREPKHFEFLRDELLRKPQRGGTFRIWSAACSSGEEPYSLSMLLAAELGLTGWEILATDISTRVLEQARAALYDLTRANPIPADFLRRFCLKGTGPQAGKFLIDRPLRERIEFRQVNLNETLPQVGQFDLILLRNVMIYFDADTKAQVVSRLLQTLKPGGHFMVGHCETLNGVTTALTMVQPAIYMKATR